MNAVTTYDPATFEAREDFEHFSDPAHPDCFACNSQNMLVRPLRVTKDFVLLPATMKHDEAFVIMPGCWLVYPRSHVTSLEGLPHYWTVFVQQAVRILRASGWLQTDDAFNTGENWGRDAGQTVQHAHTWITRRSGEEHLLSEGVGLATMIHRIKQDDVPRLS